MILAVESSCDESALALLDPFRGFAGEWVHSQLALHGEYGGVVPDLASREHLRRIGPLIREALEKVDARRVTAVAVTRGPGLAGCLALGLAAARSLSLALNTPLLGVNHLRGHAWSPFIPLHAEDPAAFGAGLAPLLPHLGLVVSGGNTILFRLDGPGRLSVLGATRDDAAGEALDKGAKLLGLGYPGGREIERLATGGDPRAFAFPRALRRRDETGFSFSGLKTSLRYQLEKMGDAEVRDAMPDLCASYQEAVVDMLVQRIRDALKAGACRSTGLSGGVAVNNRLRAAVKRASDEAGVPALFALPGHTGDNAAMIAFAAWIEEREAARDGPACPLTIDPSLPLTGF